MTVDAPSTERYRAVLFDVGETLIGPRGSFGSVYARVLVEEGVEFPVERLEEGLRRTSRAIESEIPAGVDRYRLFPGGENEYWWHFAARALEWVAGEPVDDALVDRSLTRLRDTFSGADAWEVYADTWPVLEGLRERGLDCAVVSNWDSRLPTVLQALGLDTAFSQVAVSALEGVEKPDPAIFHAVLDRLGRRPEECLHVGDRPDMDGAGARAAGVDAVIIDRDGRHPQAGYPTLRSLDELLDRV